MIDISTIDSAKLIFYIVILLSPSCKAPLEMLNIPQVYPTVNKGFSQAVTFDNLIWGSGQVGWNLNYKLTAEGSFDNQLQKALLNVLEILKSQNSNWHDVLHLRFYVVELDAAKRQKISTSLQALFSGDFLPATTLMGIEKLAFDELLIEIEFTAKTKKK